MYEATKQRLRFLILLFCLPLLVPPRGYAAEAGNPLQKGVKWYQRRAEGGGDTTADPEPINHAIAHFQRAMEGSNADTAPALYLLKSYFFKGTYVPMPSRRRRTILSRGKKLGQRMVERHPESAPLKFWYAVNLGRWSEEYGIVAAAREGIAGTMRQLCKDVIRLDPRYEGGGGYWLLGRVHYKTPYIPLFLTWPSNQDAIGLFERALEIAPDEPLTHLYYAEVLHAEGRTEEGLDHLNRILEGPVRDEMRVEDRRTKQRARVLIEQYTS